MLMSSLLLKLLLAIGPRIFSASHIKTIGGAMKTQHVLIMFQPLNKIGRTILFFVAINDCYVLNTQKINV